MQEALSPTQQYDCASPIIKDFTVFFKTFSGFVSVIMRCGEFFLHRLLVSAEGFRGLSTRQGPRRTPQGNRRRPDFCVKLYMREVRINMKCPNCGGEILHGMPMCPRCGQRVSTQAQRGKYCIHCKAVIPATAAVCPKCGKSQVQQAQQKQKPQKKSGGFRWWYVPIMLLLVMVGYVIGFSSRPQVQTKEPSKSNNSSSKAKEEASKESKPESKEENASQSEKDDVPQVEAVPLNDTEIREMYSDPDKYTGRAVKLTGKVFGDVEYSEGSVGFQMYADPSNNSMNTTVGYYGDDLTVTEGAFVKISGIVLSKFEGSNAFGGAVTAPMILAQSAEIVSYQEAVSPTIKEVVPESNSQTQLG